VADEYIQLSETSSRKVWNDLINQMEAKLKQTEADLEESSQLLYDREAKAGITPTFSSLLIGAGASTGQYGTQGVIPQAVAELKASIMGMEVQLDALRENLPEAAPEVINLKSQIAASNQKLQQEEKKAIEKYNKQFGLTKLAAEVLFSQQLYSSLVSKQEELKAQYIMQNKSPEITEKAIEPLYRSKPKRRLTLMMGAALGAFVGLGLALFLEYMDSSMHAPRDVVTSIGLPVLGRIPRLRGVKDNPGSDVLITYNGAKSARKAWIKEFYKESYRMLQLEVMAAIEEGHGDTGRLAASQNPRGLALLVTSSVPEEGKSIVAANLAISISQTGSKVLLVDADCRRPTQHELLGLDNTAGLTDILMRKATWDEVVKKTPIDNLSVVVSGWEDGQLDPSAILGSSGLEDFISSSREEFDVVIFDSPPAVLASESAAIGSKVNGIVLVIKANATKKDIIIQAKKMIQNSGGSVLGVALNFASAKKMDYRYYCRQ
jgi:capsular exopolysaccharide synthesis family protein